MKILVSRTTRREEKLLIDNCSWIRFRRLCWRSFTFTCIYSLFASRLTASPTYRWLSLTSALYKMVPSMGTHEAVRLLYRSDRLAILDSRRSCALVGN
jgi:hypothetical protein